MDLGKYRGIGQFGAAYRYMLEHDSHAPGSVDRVLLDEMIRLCPETVAYLYAEHTPTNRPHKKGTRPELDTCVREATGGRNSDEECIDALVRFCVGLGERADDDLNRMRVGGTEEEITRRGSDWCTDVARVACALFQIAGLPARLVFCANVDRAYSGHAITEVYRRGVWGALDATWGRVYRREDGEPVTTWELMSAPRLVELRGSDPGQFAAAAISNYLVLDCGRYDYTVSPVNSYYRAILEMSTRGWPGGLRWLQHEDEA